MKIEFVFGKKLKEAMKCKYEALLAKLLLDIQRSVAMNTKPLIKSHGRLHHK